MEEDTIKVPVVHSMEETVDDASLPHIMKECVVDVPVAHVLKEQVEVQRFIPQERSQQREQSFEEVKVIPWERVFGFTTSANHGGDCWSCAVGPSYATSRERDP